MGTSPNKREIFGGSFGTGRRSGVAPLRGGGGLKVAVEMGGPSGVPGVGGAPFLPRELAQRGAGGGYHSGGSRGPKIGGEPSPPADTPQLGQWRRGILDNSALKKGIFGPTPPG